MSDTSEVYVHDLIDPDAERRRLEKQKEQAEKARQAVEAKLNNENFVTKAKPEVVARAREKLAELTEQLETVEKHLSELER
jgi:valyl-tRNA synthetase